MALKIITNEKAGLKHRGNPDRDNPNDTFDRPEKLKGTLAAAALLRDAASSAALSDPDTLEGHLLRQGAGTTVEQIGFVESERTPPRSILELAHTPAYLDEFERLARIAQQKDQIHEFGLEAAVSAGTYEAAVVAVGASLDMVDHIFSAPDKTGFGLVWPPGHHAEPHQAMGFCYLNNVAIAALYARDHEAQVRPGHRNRVLVIDVDHHAGNGTRTALAEQPDVLVIDMDYEAARDPSDQHYVDYDIDPVTGEKSNAGKEYPYRKNDPLIGAQAYPITQGSNILEMRFPHTSPEVLVDSFVERALPKIRAFKPDVVLWSLGIDSAMGDHLGGLGHVPGSFYTLIRGLRLMLPDARHGGVLEGGYDETNWYRVLPACLYALHHPADDPKNHSAFFGKRRAAFEPTK